MSREGPHMNLERWKEGAGPERRLRIRNNVRVVLAAIGTLAAVFGIGIAVNGLLEFNRTKVIVGACVIVFSTVLYIVMLWRAR
jgi:Protein of unknown function (DUF2964)